MKYRKFPCILILPLLTLFYSNPVFPETTLNKMVIGDTLESIEISSDNGIEIDNKRNVVTFIGNVEAIKGDINIKYPAIMIQGEKARSKFWRSWPWKMSGSVDLTVE